MLGVCTTIMLTFSSVHEPSPGASRDTFWSMMRRHRFFGMKLSPLRRFRCLRRLYVVGTRTGRAHRLGPILVLAC
jgi:hypothetical protein